MLYHRNVCQARTDSQQHADSLPTRARVIEWASLPFY